MRPLIVTVLLIRVSLSATHSHLCGLTPSLSVAATSGFAFDAKCCIALTRYAPSSPLVDEMIVADPSNSLPASLPRTYSLRSNSSRFCALSIADFALARWSITGNVISGKSEKPRPFFFFTSSNFRSLAIVSSFTVGGSSTTLALLPSIVPFTCASNGDVVSTIVEASR